MVFSNLGHVAITVWPTVFLSHRITDVSTGAAEAKPIASPCYSSLTHSRILILFCSCLGAPGLDQAKPSRPRPNQRHITKPTASPHPLGPDTCNLSPLHRRHLHQGVRVANRP